MTLRERLNPTPKPEPQRIPEWVRRALENRLPVKEWPTRSEPVK